MRTTPNYKLKGKIIEKFGQQFIFAHKVGVTESFVSKVIRRHRDLDERQRKLWAHVLDVEPEKIF